MINALDKACVAFVARSKAMQLKGKRRDLDAITYLCGVHIGLVIADQKQEAELIDRMLSMIIVTRGFSEVEKIANEAHQKATGSL